MSREIIEALEQVFSAESEIYRNRGFGRRMGFGKHPALVIIDLGYGWTRPDNPFSCGDTDTIIAVHALFGSLPRAIRRNPAPAAASIVFPSLRCSG